MPKKVLIKDQVLKIRTLLETVLSLPNFSHYTYNFPSLPYFSHYTCNFSTHSPLASGSGRSSGVGEAVNQDIFVYFNVCEYFDFSV